MSNSGITGFLEGGKREKTRQKKYWRDSDWEFLNNNETTDPKNSKHN